MSKEIILLEDVEGLGAEGKVVNVADGYARNYLLPGRKAALVTPAARRRLESKRRERLAREEQEREESTRLGGRIEETACTLTMKAGPEGKLFGSVTAADIAEQLQLQGLQVERHQLMMEEPLRELGVFKVGVRLPAGGETTLKVWIVEE